MKNQYFGDVNDYKKYGLLRSIIRAAHFRVIIAWMLTPDDGGPDGRFTDYLNQSDAYRQNDPELFDELKRLLTDNQKRHVGLIEATDLIPMATYFSDPTPDSGPERNHWFKSLIGRIGSADLVFMDPDNGLEVKSRPYGRTSSCKFLYWREVDALWSAGKSLLIYQHFIREKRPLFIQRMLEALSQATPGSFVEAFSTANVVFFMALQPDRHRFHAAIVEEVQAHWGQRIMHWDLLRTSG